MLQRGLQRTRADEQQNGRSGLGHGTQEGREQILGALLRFELSDEEDHGGLFRNGKLAPPRRGAAPRLIGLRAKAGVVHAVRRALRYAL